jgi:hypothetical protein
MWNVSGMTQFTALLLVFGFVSTCGAEVKFGRETQLSGACDASAGVAITDDLFVAADDETNRLRIYSRSQGGAPVFELPLDRFLRVERREPEADLEGAARVADVIYWIGSHGRNQKGELRASRRRFFATRIVSVDPPRIEPMGAAYDGLLPDFENAPLLEKFDLEEASELAPKEKNALNIEGLCARPDGSLLIGFRNPVPKKKALLVPLLNPAELVNGKDLHARFGEAIRLNLDGRGIRDMVERAGSYYIIAGASGSGSRFELYQWDGAESISLLHKWEKHMFNPEAILALPGKNLFVLSDDSSKHGLLSCKDLPAVSRTFRGVVVEID